jgi:pilus assembly protein CpaB
MLKGKTPLIVAAVLGLLAFLVSWSAIKKREADVRSGWNLKQVLVANAEISEGTELTSDMLSSRPIPEKFVTASVVPPDSYQYVVGTRLLVTLQAGDPLLWTQLDTNRSAERLSTKVQKQTRAITITAHQTGSVGGWVRPNDHVDLIGTFKDPGSGEQVAVTLMQNVVVLATGRITGTTNVNLLPEGQREYGHVTLQVIPQEAEMLVLAQELGNLSMSLRNEDDVGSLEDRGRATINSLLSGERTKELARIRAATIQIIRGTSATSESHPVADQH